MVLAHAGVEADEGAAAERQRHVVLIQGEGQVVGGDVRDVEVAHGRVGGAPLAEVVHAVLVGVDVTLVLPDELGAHLDEGVLVLIEGAAVLALRVALPPGRAVHFRSGVHVAHAEVAPGVLREHPGLALGGGGAAGQGVEARGVEQAVVVGGDGHHLGDGGGTARRVQGHRHRVVPLEGIRGGDLVTLHRGAVAEVPQGDAGHAGSVLQHDDVGRRGGRAGREGQLALFGSRAQAVLVQVHRLAGEQQDSGGRDHQDGIDYLFHIAIHLSTINNQDSA